MVESESGFLYGCGCAVETVGQAFVRGQLVCPDHGEPPGPGPAVEAPFRGRANLTLHLVAGDHEDAALFLGAIVEKLLEHEFVTGIDTTLEHLA